MGKTSEELRLESSDGEVVYLCRVIRKILFEEVTFKMRLIVMSMIRVRREFQAVRIVSA